MLLASPRSALASLVTIIPVVAAALLLPSLPAFAEAELLREERLVEPFHSVRFDGRGVIDITVGREFSVVVESTLHALPHVLADVEDEQLRIRRKRRAGRAPLRIEITMPVMAALELNGSAVANVHGPLNSKSFQVRIAGSGSASIKELNVDNFGASLRGSGNLEAAGSAGDVHLTAAGSAHIGMADLVAKNAEISIDGSGEASLQVNGTLYGAINGSGKIFLTGAPEEMNVRTHGSGRIIQTAAAPSPTAPASSPEARAGTSD